MVSSGIKLSSWALRRGLFPEEKVHSVNGRSVQEVKDSVPEFLDRAKVAAANSTAAIFEQMRKEGLLK